MLYVCLDVVGDAEICPAVTDEVDATAFIKRTLHLRYMNSFQLPHVYTYCQFHTNLGVLPFDLYMGRSGSAVEHRTVNREDQGSSLPTPFQHLGNVVHPTSSVYFHIYVYTYVIQCV